VLDEREKSLPKWAQTLIAELRQRVQFGNEALLNEVAKLRPQVEFLKRRNEALTELLDCAAKGNHKTAIEIMEIIRSYSLTLTKEEE
jgi:hypothetical protein